MTASAEIFDRGYRRFDGERAGRGQGVRSVMWHTIRSILGIGRKGRHKVFPIIIGVLAFLPAVAFLALAILIGDLLEGELQPEYWELFGLPMLLVVLYATLVAPEAIVRDRRDGMLRLYLSTPLTKPTYLLAKFVAVMATMSIVVAGPVLMFLIGNTIQNLGPDGFGEWIEVLLKVLLSAFVIVLFMASVSLGASSITDRRAIASVAVLASLFGASIVINICVEAIGMSRDLLVLDPISVPLETSARIFGNVGPEYRSFEDGTVASWKVYGGAAAWIVVWLGVLVDRYRRVASV